MDKARAEGIDLVGPGRVLAGLTKTVLETSWRLSSARTWAISTILPAVIGVTRATAFTPSSFELVIVRKTSAPSGRHRCDGLSLTARGLTSGEISAHFAEVDGAAVAPDP